MPVPVSIFSVERDPDLADQVEAAVMETLDEILATLPESQLVDNTVRLRGQFLSAVVDVVAVDGSAGGRFELVVDEGVVGRLAELWFGMEPGQAGHEDVASATGELANLLAGSVKTVVAGETQLLIPEVSVLTGVSEDPTVVVDHEIGRFQILICGPMKSMDQNGDTNGCAGSSEER